VSEKWALRKELKFTFGRGIGMNFAKIHRQPSGPALIALLCLGLAACTSSSRTDQSMLPANQRPAQSDTYPDFSRPLDSAMEQMSDEQAAAMETRLSAVARQRRSGAISEAEYRRRVAELQALSAAQGQ
jgi:type IV pilus biogenesis protein CpaD/CtpE